MSSARKRSAVSKANQRADHEHQKALLAGHHASVMQGFAEGVTKKMQTLEEENTRLMVEFDRAKVAALELALRIVDDAGLTYDPRVQHPDQPMLDKIKRRIKEELTAPSWNHD